MYFPRFARTNGITILRSLPRKISLKLRRTFLGFSRGETFQRSFCARWGTLIRAAWRGTRVFSVSCRVNCIPISAQTAFPSTSPTCNSWQCDQIEATLVSFPVHFSFLQISSFSFLFYFSFFVNFQFSVLVSRTERIIPITRSWKSFVDQKLLEFVDSMQCLSRKVRY